MGCFGVRFIFFGPFGVSASPNKICNFPKHARVRGRTVPSETFSSGGDLPGSSRREVEEPAPFGVGRVGITVRPSSRAHESNIGVGRGGPPTAQVSGLRSGPSASGEITPTSSDRRWPKPSATIKAEADGFPHSPVSTRPANLRSALGCIVDSVEAELRRARGKPRPTAACRPRAHLPEARSEPPRGGPAPKCGVRRAWHSSRCRQPGRERGAHPTPAQTVGCSVKGSCLKITLPSSTATVRPRHERRTALLRVFRIRNRK